MPGLISYTTHRSRVPEPEGNPGIGYRLKVTCTGFAGGQDTAIFCFKRVAPDLAQFSHVASYADMEDFAVGIPVDPGVPFFRAAEVDLIFRDPQLLEETWALMLNDFEILTTGADVTAVLSSVSSGAIPAPERVETAGAFSGDAVADTYRVNFPVAYAAVPQVYTRTSSPFGIAVTVDTAGFDVVASRTLTPSDVVSWHVG